VVRGLSLTNRRSYSEIHAVPKMAIGNSELQVEDKVDEAYKKYSQVQTKWDLRFKKRPHLVV
jgi:hypothetical protein